MAERPANGGPRRFPRLALQQTKPRVRIPETGLNEEVTPAKRRAQSIQAAEDVGFGVRFTLRFAQVVAPDACNDLPRRIPGLGSALLFDVAQVLQRRQDGLTGRGRAETHRPQQAW